MINPIPHSGMFATPESVEALTAYIEQMNGSERALAYTIAMMTFNLSHNLIEQLHVKESV